jgi:trk system potassium uptake protein
MRILVIGAGQVGAAIVEALHREHELTVIDLDPVRLSRLSYRFDIETIDGNGASRRTLDEAGVREADLLIACTSRDDTNIVAAIFAKKLSPQTRTIVRTANVEYLEIWRERQLDADFLVSTELETAYAISSIIGVPAARQTDVFAEGQVQIVEFDVPSGLENGKLIGVPLRQAEIPADSKVASIIRAGEMRLPRGDESIQPGDRIIVIGSPRAARVWSSAMAPSAERVGTVVIFGCGRIGEAVARVLVDRDIDVRVIESDHQRAREVAAQLPETRVFHATGIDPDFLERERIGQADAAIFAMQNDAKNHYAATLAKLHGVRFTIAVVHEAPSEEVFERAGVDVTINPRLVTAEEIVRFAHDPRTQQVAMLEGDRFEVLDITVRPESKLLNTPFRELPMTGSLIGAVIRDGKAIFPHGDDVLRAGDRVIVFAESARVQQVERAL